MGYGYVIFVYKNKFALWVPIQFSEATLNGELAVYNVKSIGYAYSRWAVEILLVWLGSTV